MGELTDEQKAEAEKIMNDLIDYLWGKVKDRMMRFNETIEQATVMVIQEALKNG